MKKPILETVGAVATLGAIFLLPWVYSEPEFHETLGYCHAEDVTPLYEPCYWDAEKLGNGHGESFIAYPNGTVEYIED